MSAFIEKVCDPNGAVFYRVSIKMPNGMMKAENHARLYDAKNAAKKLEMEEIKQKSGNLGHTNYKKLVGFVDE